MTIITYYECETCGKRSEDEHSLAYQICFTNHIRSEKSRNICASCYKTITAFIEGLWNGKKRRDPDPRSLPEKEWEIIGDTVIIRDLPLKDKKFNLKESIKNVLP